MGKQREASKDATSKKAGLDQGAVSIVTEGPQMERPFHLTGPDQSPGRGAWNKTSCGRKEVKVALVFGGVERVDGSRSTTSVREIGVNSGRR